MGTPGNGQETRAKRPNQVIAKARVQAQLRREVRSQGILRDIGKRRQNQVRGTTERSGLEMTNGTS